GYAFKSRLFEQKGVAVVRMSNLKRGQLDLSEAARISPHHLDGLERFELRQGDVLLGLSGSVGPTGSLGNYGLVTGGDLPCVLNQRVATIKSTSRDKWIPIYCFQVVSSDWFRRR